MKTLLWIIAIMALQGILAAAARKAKSNQASAGAPGARPVGSARGSARGSAAPPATPPVVQVGSRGPTPRKPVVLARGATTREGARSSGAAARPDAPVPGGRGAVAANGRRGEGRGRGPARSTASRSTAASGGTSTKPSPVSPDARTATGEGARRGASGVASSIARVQAAEARITGLPDIEIAAPAIAAAPSSAASEVAASMRRRDEVRRAVLLSEILGAPRAMRPYGA